jgi:hypothetical protein
MDRGNAENMQARESAQMPMQPKTSTIHRMTSTLNAANLTITVFITQSF